MLNYQSVSWNKQPEVEPTLSCQYGTQTFEDGADGLLISKVVSDLFCQGF